VVVAFVDPSHASGVPAQRVPQVVVGSCSPGPPGHLLATAGGQSAAAHTPVAGEVAADTEDPAAEPVAAAAAAAEPGSRVAAGIARIAGIADRDMMPS